MTIRKLFFLFWTTLAIGMVTAPVAGLLLQGLFGLAGLSFLSLLWAGVMFGAIAQMGFFAYMVFNMVFTGFIRNQRVYQGLQLVLALAILVNTFFMSLNRGGEEASAVSHLILPLTVLGAGLLVGYLKVKATQPKSFIPALFFMVAATMLEAVPSIEQKSLEMMMLMVLTLLMCNAWQVMQLHRLVGSTPRGNVNDSRSQPEKKKKQKS
ncbi:KinB-signaling pathway activation protein [Paludifilum halophilum]|nr:KinB-signaling pathway activation protein [Paludifilum halophilum]